MSEKSIWYRYWVIYNFDFVKFWFCKYKEFLRVDSTIHSGSLVAQLDELLVKISDTISTFIMPFSPNVTKFKLVAALFHYFSNVYLQRFAILSCNVNLRIICSVAYLDLKRGRSEFLYMRTPSLYYESLSYWMISGYTERKIAFI